MSAKSPWSLVLRPWSILWSIVPGAVLLSLLLVPGLETSGHAQDGPTQVTQAPPAGGWNFEDEEEDVPTWSEDIRAQAPDVLAVGAFLTFAFVSFFRKSVALKYATLAGAVAFLGFYKSQLVSIVNVFGLFGGNLPIFRQNLAWYLLTIVTVVSTVLWGRVYCGRLCAFGAFTQLMDRIAPDRWQIKIPRLVERRASLIKYGILAFAIAYFVVTRDPLIYPYIEPFWMFGLHGTTPLWIALAVLLVVSLFVRNAYCRFLCPVGAALGLLSKLTVFRIKRWPECSHCRICEKACEWGAIRGPQIILSECVRCDDCERLYEDTKKCPHHLIIIRKADIMARRSARASAPAAP